MIHFISLFIILCIFQYLYGKYVNKSESVSDKNMSHKIEYIKKNKKNIDTHIQYTLKERINLLESGKLNYEEWIDYNIKNKLININYSEYLYINIFENISNTDNFIIRVNEDDLMINQSWYDLITRSNNILYNTRYKVDINLINNMFNNYITDSELNSINYYWIEPKNYITVQKKNYFIRFKSKDGIEGIISIGYPINNLLNFETFKKINNIYGFKVIIAYIVLFIICFTILFLNIGTYVQLKAYILLLIINIYFWFYFNSNDHLSTTKSESEKLTLFSSNLLSISYLIGVNIYIVSSLNEFQNNNLTMETVMLFGFSLLLLLICIYKPGSYNTINDLIKQRISINFLFNYSIILNILIVINYLLFKFNINFTSKIRFKKK